MSWQIDYRVDGQHTARLPNRGTILCIFAQDQSVEAYESAFSCTGFTLVRARDEQHGLWLSVTTRPDVIITDLIDPSDESNGLLDSLRRNEKTRGTPVVAIVSELAQTRPGASCLRLTTACFLGGTEPPAVIAEVDRLVATAAAATKQARVAGLRLDAPSSARSLRATVLRNDQSFAVSEIDRI